MSKFTCVPCDSYASKAYWQKRYEEGLINHEWYYGFDTLRPILQTFRDWKPTDKILEVGCGDKPLIFGFLEFGLDSSNLFAIDYAKSIVDNLSMQHPHIIFQEMDACDMSFKSGDFSCVVDKGTLDAILSHNNRKIGVRNGRKLISEIARVMQDDAQFMLVSHIEVDSEEFDVLMHEILLPALSTKSQLMWSVEAHIVSTSSQPQKKKTKRIEPTLEEPSGYGTVYVVKCRPRRFTRSSLNKDQSTADVSFKVMEYELD